MRSQGQGRFPRAGRCREGMRCHPPGCCPHVPPLREARSGRGSGAGGAAGSALLRSPASEANSGTQSSPSRAAPSISEPLSPVPEPSSGWPHTRLGAGGGAARQSNLRGSHGAAAPERIKGLWVVGFQLSNAACERKVRLLGEQLTGMEKTYFLQIRSTCLLVLKVVLCFNSLKTQRYHLWETKRTTMMVSIYHTFSAQKRQIIKLIAEYRYIAKVVWFHNILLLQTILPLHNFTNYLKMFLLKANMIYTNLSEAAGIWRKADAFTVWKTRLYLGTQTEIKTAALGKRYKNFQSGITFSSSLSTSLKLQYKTKHGLLFVCLFGWLYLSMFSCSHRYSKSYDTPLFLCSNTRARYQQLWSIPRAFFFF